MSEHTVIVAFVGETFESFKGEFYAKPTSAAFLQDAVGVENVYVCSPAVDVISKPKSFSTKVNASRFYRFPRYSSTKDFVKKCLLKPSFFKSYVKAADEVIANHKGKYFWIRTPSFGSILFGLRALKAGEKVLHHMCADASNTWRDSKYSGVDRVLGYLLSRYIRMKLKQICRHPNAVNLCTGNVLERFSKNIAPERTFQFIDVMVKPPKDLIEKYKKNKKLYLLFVGRVVEDKGVFDLLNVAAQLSGYCHVTVVGDGPDFEKAETLSRHLLLNDMVEFTGQLPHQKLSDIYNRCDLAIVPSKNYYEGFPRVIMEAWSHHKPVIVADVGGIRAFVKDGENGLIFEPGNTSQLLDCVQKLIDDSKLYSKLKVNAKAMANTSRQDYWLDVLRSHL